jgi:hypothetical protein
MPRKSEPFDLFVDWNNESQRQYEYDMSHMSRVFRHGVGPDWKPRVISCKVEREDTQLAS